MESEKNLTTLEMEAAAQAYSEEGFNVFPIRHKQPLTKWQNWITNRQTPDEFSNLNFSDADGLGVVCGTPNNQNLHLAVFDFDIKNLPEETVNKGREVIKLLPSTAVEETPSGGLHYIYYVKKPPVTNKSFHGKAAVELLGKGCYCAMAPSQGYRRINSEPPAVLEDANAVFEEVLEKAQVAQKQQQHSAPQRQISVNMEKNTVKKTPRPCITAALQQQLTGAPGHRMRLAAAAEYRRCGYSDAEIVDLFRNQADFNPEVCWTQVQSADPSKTASCKTISGYGFCLPDCKLKSKGNGDAEEPKIVYVHKPTVLTADFLAEMVWNRRDPPEYVIYNFESDTFTRQKEIDLGETDAKGRQIIYVPPFNDQVKKVLVLVPSDVAETTFKAMFEEIDRFAASAYDACGQDALVKLLVRIAVSSWFLDRFVADPMFDVAGAGKFAPILPIRGPSQSGKNRLAFVLRLLSYRPYFEMSTYRIPSLYRPLDLWQGTLVLDEADFANTTEKSELVHFLNCRATGTPLSRQNPKNPKLTDTFSNFGLTIVTQRRPFDDNATESRAIPYYSETSDKKLPVIETDEMLKQGLALQNKLLYLRMKFFRKVTIDKDAWVNDLTDHRLVASLLPLLALSKHEPSLKETITKTAKEVEKAKIEEKANSMDGLIVNYLWEKISEGLFENWRPNIFYVLESREIEKNNGIDEEHKVALTTSKIAEQFKWSPQSIRKALSSLGIAEKGLNNLVRVDGEKPQKVIFFEPKRLEKRLREFVSDYEFGKVLSVTGVTDVTVSMRSADKNSLLAYAENTENSDTLHRKTVTTVTTVTNPASENSDALHSKNVTVAAPASAASSVVFPDEQAWVNRLIAKLGLGGLVGFENWLAQFRLPPSSAQPCEGEFHGGDCPFSSEFWLKTTVDVKYWFFCRGHFLKVAVACVENGFTFEEVPP